MPRARGRPAPWSLLCGGRLSLSLCSLGRRPSPVGSHLEPSTFYRCPHLPPWALWVLSQPLACGPLQALTEGGNAEPTAAPGDPWGDVSCLRPVYPISGCSLRCSDSPVTQMRAGQQLGTGRFLIIDTLPPVPTLQKFAEMEAPFLGQVLPGPSSPPFISASTSPTEMV